MAKRINVVLQDRTLRSIDRLVPPGRRSRFIERAVQHYMTTASRDALRERLKMAALRDGDLDREIAQDWSRVDQEQWYRLGVHEKRQAGRKGAKSTSPRSTRR